ncbi:MAG TPA: hypothetical protein VGI66_01235 [Streptosporangiaceae bacterium]
MAPRSGASVFDDYRAPGSFTRNVFNRLVAFLTRQGISVPGAAFERRWGHLHCRSSLPMVAPILRGCRDGGEGLASGQRRGTRQAVPVRSAGLLRWL